MFAVTDKNTCTIQGPEALGALGIYCPLVIFFTVTLNEFTNIQVTLIFTPRTIKSSKKD